MKFYFLLSLLVTSPFLCFGQLQEIESALKQKDYKTIRQILKKNQVTTNSETKLLLLEAFLANDNKSALEMYEILTPDIFQRWVNPFHLPTNPKYPNKNALYSTKLNELRAIQKENKEWTAWTHLSNIAATTAFYEQDVRKAGQIYLEIEKHIKKASKKAQLKIYIKIANYEMGINQNYEKAEQFYFEADQLITDARQKVGNYNHLSELYIRKKDYERALEFIQKIIDSPSITLLQKQEASLRRVNILKIQGNILAAKKTLKEIKEQLPPPTAQNLSNPFLNRVVWSYFTKDIDLSLYDGTADDILREKIAFLEAALFDKTLGQINPFAQIELSTNLIKAATKLREEDTTKIHTYVFKYPGNPPLNILLTNNLALGNYYYQKKLYDKAILYYNQILETCSDSQRKEAIRSYPINSPIAFEALVQKIKILRKNNKLKSQSKLLYQHIQESVLLLEQLRHTQTTTSAKLEILKETDWVFQTAIETCYDLYHNTKKQEYLEQVYILIEKSKSVLLADILNDKKAKQHSNIPQELQKEEKDLLRDLNIYEAQLYQAQKVGDSLKIKSNQNIIFEKRNQLQTLQKNITEQFPNYHKLAQQNNIVPLSDLKQLLKEQAAIFVSYFVRYDAVYIFCTDDIKTTIRKVDLPSDQMTTLSHSVRSVRNFLSNFSKIREIKQKEFEAFQSQSYSLYYNLLGRDLTNLSSDNKRLIISADGSLNYLPFETFITERPKKIDEEVNYQTPSYLIQQYPISYHYTASLWYAAQYYTPKSQNKKNILAMSATYAPHSSKTNTPWAKLRQNLLDLEGADREVSYLQRTFDGSYFIGASATEQAFKETASEHSIIHLALHGFVDPSSPMNSGLVFSDNATPDDNNILQSYEIQSLELNANLVVLSACSTGEGAYQKGEGIISLGRSFLYAGTSSIIVTLWPINDVASERVVNYFYSNLQAGMDKDIALQQAKLIYLKNSQGFGGHPAFWAPMILLGNNQPIHLDNEIPWLWILGSVIMVGGGLLLIKNRKTAII